MSRKNYGLPYKGSKNKIAEDIINFLPEKKILVDLFGGGGAISDCAIQSGKYEQVIYNEIDTIIAETFKKALNGEYKNETRWISREDFHKLKDVDGYVAICFSFSNNCKTYMYSPKIEPYKRAYHYAVVLDDFQPLSELFDKETVEKLKKSVEGLTDTKQRRLSFTKELGKYILGLIEEEEKRKELLKTVNLINGSRQLLANLERNERLDELKHSVHLVNNKFPGHVIQNKERQEQIDTLKHTVNMIDNTTRTVNVLVNQERTEHLNELKHTLQINDEGINKHNLIQNEQRKDRLNELKHTLEFDNNNPRHTIQNQERNEKIIGIPKNTIEILNNDYADVVLPKPNDCVLYCDIPYEHTDKYTKSEVFDYERFYKWVEQKKNEGYDIYVSSYSLPEDRFTEVWSKERYGKTVGSKGQHTIEKIFIPK